MPVLSAPQRSAAHQLQTMSTGAKLILVGVLALLMGIPSLFVLGLLQDRTSRAAEVVQQVTDQVGGRQTFLGPTLVIPYTVAARFPGDAEKTGSYFVFPAEATGRLNTATQERRRSLFKVPVFQTEAKFNATFDLRGVPANAPEGAVLNWTRAEIVVGVSDARGALADGTVTVGGRALALVPAEIAQTLDLTATGGPAMKLALFGAGAVDFAEPGSQFSLSCALRFAGAQRVAVLAYGKTTRVAMQGDWPSPGFDGGFAASHRHVSKAGFSADWSVPFIARGVAAEGPADVLANLGATAMGVSFIEVANPYQSVSRSLKYVLLFLGLVFLSYFVFELTTGKRLHPAQYLLVGVAQLLFYVLLLSLSERIGFSFGFLIAGTATVVLLAMNAKWVFASTREGLRAFAIFSLLYVLIYMLLRLEDDALLIGAMASFAAVALAMYLTRQVNWYSHSSAEQPLVEPPLVGVPGNTA
jgi:inner membrane protein